MDSSSQPEYSQLIHLAWTRRMEVTQLLEHAGELQRQQRTELAAVLYQTWIARNRTAHDHCVCFNLGVLLYGEGDLLGAQQAYERAIALAPNFAHPRFNLGLVHERQGRYDDAVEQWRWITANVQADTPEQRAILIVAYNNLGRLQENRKQYDEALDCLEKSLLLDAQQPDAIHHWVFIREKMCRWPVYAPLGEVSLEAMRRSTSALAMLSLSDDPAEQLATARRYAERKIPADLPALAPAEGYGHRRLRIGYCSSDLCLHPVAMLTVELFELHDRERFEVYTFCWSPEDGSDLRRRIVNASDHFIRIDALDDHAAAQLIRAHEIDILVDLHGQTHGARTTMLALRPAPVQITYLGLPATTGLPYIDYVVADRFLIPEDCVQHYSERPLYMPEVYQISDRQRLCAPPPTRRSCGLPADGFVFCSFNNNYKFTAPVFAAWMNILRRVPDSVLWLLADNPWAEASLREAAGAHGIDGQRLVFATRAAPPVYLARYQLADLFLDTFPFNAGTTANDALWMSLPLLTLSGHTFAARMAGALLTAAGLDELITYDLQSYEDAAVALANSPERCRALREHLGEARENGVLFDTPRFVRNYERLLLDLPPAGPPAQAA